MFAVKRERPDIHQKSSVLPMRVKEPNDTDWQKVARMIRYLNETKKNYLILSAYDLKRVKWYMDVSFVVHPDFKIPTGEIITMVEVSMQSVYRKHRLNKIIITDTELVVDDDELVLFWVVLFIE